MHVAIKTWFLNLWGITQFAKEESIVTLYERESIVTVYNNESDVVTRQ